jgi:hypothetical protein
MTIQEHISEKLWKAKIIGFVFWLAFALTIFLPFDKEFFFLSIIPFIGFAGTALYILFFIRCPRCAARLGRTSIASGSPFQSKIKLNHCPKCGVNLNENI